MSVAALRCPRIPLRMPGDRTTSPHLEDHEGSCRVHAAVAVLAAFVTIGAATHAPAQTLNPEAAPAQGRLLVLSPTIALTNVGWDDNIFRVNKADGPTGDFTATLSPAIQASLQVARVNVTGRSRLDFIYFRDTSQINSIDRDGGGRVELSLGRLLPFAGGAWANARHRRNFEIDLPIRRLDSSWNMGVDLRLSGKTTIGVMTQRSREDYQGDTIYRDTDLAQYLRARATIQWCQGPVPCNPPDYPGSSLRAGPERIPRVCGTQF